MAYTLSVLCSNVCQSLMLKSYQDRGMSYRLQDFIYINHGDGLKHGICRLQEQLVLVLIYESAQKEGEG